MRGLTVLLMLVAGCAREAPPSTDQAACERQANNDPVVKQLIEKGAVNPHFQMEGADQLRAAKQDATLTCLRARGIVRPGGVERQKPI